LRVNLRRLFYLEANMALFRRGGFAPFSRGGIVLTPPSTLVFVISLALAVIALLSQYGIIHIAMLGSGRAFLMLAVAYVVLFAGVLVRGL
jgi:hypothetical protein